MPDLPRDEAAAFAGRTWIMGYPEDTPLRPPLELWAGVECSVVRVGDAYHDQLEWCGEASRVDDLERIADLGIRALRQPVLWERTAPNGPACADWTWADDRLGRLRSLGVRPIVGLVHHGSGPRHTSLVDPSFADGLAAYAGAVARRYPWVADYTPVNEPLTTARFSGLYGLWYPHGRDDRLFARALLNQCRATVLAMRAIRRVNPAARLVQTEDLGKTHSTPPLAYQADYENQRRWLALDLLCGCVDPGHPLWRDLIRMGVTAGELRWFLDNPCAPDLFGGNHYLTSERFLDHRLEHYPAGLHGGNGRHAYADVEAVRVLAGGAAGPRALLGELWRRYRRPVAITEVHLGCTREEQLRWLREVWDAAQAARRDGVEVRAVTAWAVLGSYDWDSLLTVRRGRYEPGAYDVRAPRPRPTALSGLLRDLAAGRVPDHPVLDGPGWWRQPGRLLYPPPPGRPDGATGRPRPPSRVRRILIIGASGRLGRTFSRLCDVRGLPRECPSRGELDLLDGDSIEAILDRLRPWAVVNAAGYADIDGAEREPYACRRINADSAARLAAACTRRGIALLGISSDQVFGGDRDLPYLESCPVRPRNAFGAAHAAMEQAVLEAHPGALIARTGGLFGPRDAGLVAADALQRLDEGRPFEVPDDLIVSPTYAPDFVNAALDLLIDGECGVWHLANAGALSWAQFARRAAILSGLDPSGVRGVPTGSLGLTAPRPAYSVLGSERGWLLPDLDDALARYIGSGEGPRPERAPIGQGVRSRCA